MVAISSLINKVKKSMEVTYDELKAKPHLLETDDNNVKHLEKEVLKEVAYSPLAARKAAEAFLRSKLFPPSIRSKLWIALIENKHQINSKLYKPYLETIEKKLAENESYGRQVC